MTNTTVKTFAAALVRDIQRDAKSNAERVQRNANALRDIIGAELAESFCKSWKAGGYALAIAHGDFKAVKAAIGAIVDGVKDAATKAGITGEPWKGVRNQLRVALASLHGISREDALSATFGTNKPTGKSESSLKPAGKEQARNDANAPQFSADKVESGAGESVPPVLAQYRSLLAVAARLLTERAKFQPVTAADKRDLQSILAAIGAAEASKPAARVTLPSIGKANGAAMEVAH